MKRTITQLWYGQITPCEKCGENDPEIKELLQLIDCNRQTLVQDLSLQQKDTLEKLLSCYEEYADLLILQAFSDGVCLASKLLTESLA